MCEDAPCCGCCGPDGDGAEEYFGREDDLQDYNDREAEDYADEEGHEGEDDERDGYYGNEDSHLDGMGEE